MNAMTLPNRNAINQNQSEGTPYRVLQSLVEKQASGKLVIQNPLDPSIHWRVYLGNGRIHYAGSGIG